MSESEKQEGDLENADGVTTDSEGNLKLRMEVLQKGGSSDGTEPSSESGDSE